MPGLRFELDLSSPINTKYACFCRDEDYCPPHGAIDLFRCNGILKNYINTELMGANADFFAHHVFFFVKNHCSKKAFTRLQLSYKILNATSNNIFFLLGIPLVATLPHFFKAEQLLEKVQSGLNPQYEKHATFSVFEIMTGTP